MNKKSSALIREQRWHWLQRYTNDKWTAKLSDSLRRAENIQEKDEEKPSLLTKLAFQWLSNCRAKQAHHKYKRWKLLPRLHHRNCTKSAPKFKLSCVCACVHERNNQCKLGYTKQRSLFIAHKATTSPEPLKHCSLLMMNSVTCQLLWLCVSINRW